MSAKIRPNDRCPCGSGLKYKKCCGGVNPPPFAKDIYDFNRLIAYEGEIGRKRRKFCETMQKFMGKYYRTVMAHSNEVAKAAGKTITCAPGCSYCCCQFISTSLQEAEAIVFYLYDQGKDNLDFFINAYEAWRQRTKQLEIFDQLMQLGQAAISDDQTVKKLYMALAEQYSELNIPCPFLKENRCIIYRARPKVCASYVACSPPDHCDVTNDLKHDAFMTMDYNAIVPYPFSPDAMIYANAPLLVYELLKGGYMYLSNMPGLEGLESQVFQDPAVTRIGKRNAHLFEGMF